MYVQEIGSSRVDAGMGVCRNAAAVEEKIKRFSRNGAKNAKGGDAGGEINEIKIRSPFSRG